MKTFEELRKINCNEHTEKKNGLTYLSWAWAVDLLLQNDPKATWEYLEPKQWGETWMVFCKVYAFDKAMTAQLPVLDYRNKAIQNPDAMAINTAMQRCLAKAIGLHGIGLYIYAGEDIPIEDSVHLPAAPISPTTGAWDHVSEDMQIYLKELAEEIKGELEEGKVEFAVEMLDLAKLSQENKIALWTLLDSKQRAAIKKEIERQKI